MRKNTFELDKNNINQAIDAYNMFNNKALEVLDNFEYLKDTIDVLLEQQFERFKQHILSYVSLEEFFEWFELEKNPFSSSLNYRGNLIELENNSSKEDIKVRESYNKLIELLKNKFSIVIDMDNNKELFEKIYSYLSYENFLVNNKYSDMVINNTDIEYLKEHGSKMNFFNRIFTSKEKTNRIKTIYSILLSKIEDFQIWIEKSEKLKQNTEFSIIQQNINDNFLKYKNILYEEFKVDFNDISFESANMIIELISNYNVKMIFQESDFSTILKELLGKVLNNLLEIEKEIQKVEANFNKEKTTLENSMKIYKSGNTSNIIFNYDEKNDWDTNLLVAITNYINHRERYETIKNTINQEEINSSIKLIDELIKNKNIQRFIPNYYTKIKQIIELIRTGTSKLEEKFDEQSFWKLMSMSNIWDLYLKNQTDYLKVIEKFSILSNLQFYSEKLQANINILEKQNVTNKIVEKIEDSSNPKITRTAIKYESKIQLTPEEKLIKFLEKEYTSKQIPISVKELTEKLEKESLLNDRNLIAIFYASEKDKLVDLLKVNGFTNLEKNYDLTNLNETAVEDKDIKVESKEIVKTNDNKEKSNEFFSLNDLLNSSEFKQEVKDFNLHESFAENVEMIDEFKKTKNQDLYSTIVVNNQKLVMKVASRYLKIIRRTTLTYEDLISVGNLGLMKAIDKFDPSLGYQFSTYAVHWIKQQISREIQNTGNTIRIPVHMQELIYNINKLEFANSDNAQETDDDKIIKELEITEERLDFARYVRDIFMQTSSLDIPVGEDGDTTLGDYVATTDKANSITELSEVFFDPYYLLEKNELNVELDRLLRNVLTDREERIIRQRFGIGEIEQQTLESIGEIEGVTRERIRQIQNEALRKLRKRLNNKLDMLERVSKL